MFAAFLNSFWKMGLDFHETDINIIIFKNHHTFAIFIPTIGNDIVAN